MCYKGQSTHKHHNYLFWLVLIFERLQKTTKIIPMVLNENVLLKCPKFAYVAQSKERYLIKIKYS